MDKILFWVLFSIFAVYFVFSCYMLNGYAAMNDKLQRVNDTLLKSCTISKIQSYENEKYK